MSAQLLLQHFTDKSAIARAVDCTPQAVNKWFRPDGKIPPDRCVQLERHLSRAVLCEQLRPDLDWRRDPLGQPYVVTTFPVAA